MASTLRGLSKAGLGRIPRLFWFVWQHPSNTLIGAATEVVAGGVNDTIGRARLNGVA
jgi:hypothetical protein